MNGSSPATSAVSISAAAQFACAVFQTGEGKCWGYGDTGQRGDGNLASEVHSPAAMVGLDGSDGNKAVAITTNGIQNYGSSVCVLTDYGEVKCSGHIGKGGHFNLENRDIHAVEALPGVSSGNMTGDVYSVYSVD